jgi:imidazole glycerol-phosphate synthase subunit HisH
VTRAPSIAVLDYGMGNIHSVSRALTAAGGDVVVTDDDAAVQRADALLIPGVGHFGACVRALRDAGLEQAARDFVASGRPVFGVCVGMQILFDGSDEDAEAGLGILPGTVRKLPDTVKVPHMGWNTVNWSGRGHPYTTGIADGTYFYFVHSFAPEPTAAMTGATEHGRAFAAVVAKDNVFATQFHPEKSGDAGLRLYASFVREVRAA